MTIRVTIADDHEIFREGLCIVLREAQDIEIVGCAENGQGAIDLAVQERPDVALLDISMPGINGIEATAHICSARPATRVLCLSMHREKSFLTAMLAAGASGYLLKECAPAELRAAIRTVVAAGSYFSPVLSTMLADGYRTGTPRAVASRAAVLTRRESQTLKLIAEGHATKQIAAKLRVSVKTVGSHRENLKGKLGIRSVAGLTKFAIRAGLTTMDRDMKL